MHFEIRWRKKPRSILQIKKSKCKSLKLTHTLKELDSGTSGKTYEKENFLLIENNHISQISILGDECYCALSDVPINEIFKF